MHEYYTYYYYLRVKTIEHYIFVSLYAGLRVLQYTKVNKIHFAQQSLWIIQINIRAVKPCSTIILILINVIIRNFSVKSFWGSVKNITQILTYLCRPFDKFYCHHQDLCMNTKEMSYTTEQLFAWTCWWQ